MAFIVKTQKGYIKRTSSFGMFHGNIVLTDDVNEALKFTRRHDAERRGHITSSRTKQADNEGTWNSREGRDLPKFGETLIATIEEV